MDQQETSKSEAISIEPKREDVVAWQQIEAGRYQPRRIRGSYRGRELG